MTLAWDGSSTLHAPDRVDRDAQVFGCFREGSHGCPSCYLGGWRNRLDAWAPLVALGNHESGNEHGDPVVPGASAIDGAIDCSKPVGSVFVCCD